MTAMTGEATAAAEREFNAMMRETARRVIGGKPIERRTRDSPPGVGRGGERRHSLRIKALPTPTYTERARTTQPATTGSRGPVSATTGSGPCDADNTSAGAARVSAANDDTRRHSVSNWSWEDSDASNESFGVGESDRRTSSISDPSIIPGTKSRRASNDPAGPSFVKVMAPTHISGHYYADAPLGLADWLPNETATLVLTCDGEEWKTVWLVDGSLHGEDGVDSRPRAGLSGGWRGFAVDQRLAVGDVCVFTVERGARVSVNIHRATSKSAEKARETAFADAGARTDAFVRFATGHEGGVHARHRGGMNEGNVSSKSSVPRCGGTCRSLHVYSRRRQGKYDTAAAAAARRRTGASATECAKIAREELDGVVGTHAVGGARHSPRLIHAAHDAGSPSRWVRAGMVPSPPPPAGQLPFASPKARTPKKNARRRPESSQISASPSDPAAPLGSPGGAVTPAPPGTTEREAAAAAAAVAPLKGGVVPAGRRNRRQSFGGAQAVDPGGHGTKPHLGDTQGTWATPADPRDGGVLPRDAGGELAKLSPRRSLRLGEEDTPAVRTGLWVGRADVPPPAPKAIRSRPPRRCAPVRIPDKVAGGSERAGGGEGTPLSQVFRSTKRARKTPMFVTPV